jgi:hypothetical protein
MRPHRTSFAGKVLAGVLLLVLLAGAVPFSSLASSHECTMSCCVGKPAHLAGSCSTALGDDAEAESPAREEGEEEDVAAEAAHGDHHMMRESGESAAAAPATKATEHPEAATGHSAHHSTSGRKSPQSSSVASQAAMTTPCSAECAAAATLYSQVRRPRDPASSAISARGLRPHIHQFIFSRFYKTLTDATGRRKLSRPRAPPFISR